MPRPQFTLQALLVAMLGIALLCGAAQAENLLFCFVGILGAGAVLGAAVGMPQGKGEDFAAFGCAIGYVLGGLACAAKIIWILDAMTPLGPGIFD
jgi:hypothetical protein